MTRTIDYTILPDHCQDEMRCYIEHGIEPGAFLQAVLSNELVDAFACADHINCAAMADWANFLYNELPGRGPGGPGAPWGSREAVQAWIDAHAGRAQGEA